jgi:uncharacterized protein YkwD
MSSEDKMPRRLVVVVIAFALLALIGSGPAFAASARSHAAVHHTAHHKKPAKKAKKKVVQHARQAAAKPKPAPTTTTAAAPAPAAAPAAPTSCPDGDLMPTSADLDRIRAATICLINMQRAAAGVGQLTERTDLDAAAQSHTDDMVASDYFDHVAPTGVGLLDRVLATGYASLDALLGLGENIAAAGGPLATPNATVAGWMSSPDHRANILDPDFTDTGLGVDAALPASVGLGSVGATYTQVFGATAT